ncbi:MAG: helix-turn-helix domain-containing protein, partial [Acidiferrobacterales bacterium]
MAPNLVEHTKMTHRNARSDTLLARSQDYARVGEALEYVVTHTVDQPELSEIAEHVGLSDYHFQRLFTRWVGISPKKFLQYVTLSQAKQRLSESTSVLDAALEVGLSGPGRLHDLFITSDAVTPGEYKRHGLGLT